MSGTRLYIPVKAGLEITEASARKLCFNYGGREGYSLRSPSHILRDVAITVIESALALRRGGVPYKVYGGLKFFDRAEVKDMLSYLCVINNRPDDLRLKRIINNPPRGLGPKTIETATRLAQAEGKPL